MPNNGTKGDQAWNILPAGIFNLKASFESGQPLTFHADYAESEDAEALRYVTSRGIIEIESGKNHVNNVVKYRYCGDYSKTLARNEIVNRLALQDNMSEIYERINTDVFIDGSIKSHYGLRITQNEPWEAVLCFIISQFNNIKRIRGIVKKLIERFGEERRLGERTIKLFPTTEAISRAPVRELMACGTGFRAKYIKSVSEQCSGSVDLTEPYAMDYEEAKGLLMELDGIGDKVADCILLMGYKKLEAFPIDVWMKRTMEKLYFDSRKKKVESIHGFAEERWGAYAGYAQQYLFHNARLRGI